MRTRCLSIIYHIISYRFVANKTQHTYPQLNYRYRYRYHTTYNNKNMRIKIIKNIQKWPLLKLSKRIKNKNWDWDFAFKMNMSESSMSVWRCVYIDGCVWVWCVCVCERDIAGVPVLFSSFELFSFSFHVVVTEVFLDSSTPSLVRQ